MSVEIASLTLGVFQTNCYLVADSASRQAILIDPADEADAILNLTASRDWQIAHILVTHAHVDHVLALGAVQARTGAPSAMHADAAQALREMPDMVRRYFGAAIAAVPQPPPQRLLSTEPETITLGAITLHTLYTPGHAPGHLSFYLPAQGVVFAGDTLFAGSIGRTDLPGGDLAVLLASIRDKLLNLPGDTVVCPGHGPATTIDRERRSNVALFLQA